MIDDYSATDMARYQARQLLNAGGHRPRNTDAHAYIRGFMWGFAAGVTALTAAIIGFTIGAQ